MENTHFIVNTALLVLLATICTLNVTYTVPTAMNEVFKKGFEVAIPDEEEGIPPFAFPGKFNEEMDGLEVGTWARDITKVRKGRWTFRARNAQLKIGDTLYYWTYEVFNGLGYREDDSLYAVKEVVYKSGTMPLDTKPKTPNCEPSRTVLKNGETPPCAGQVVFADEFTGTALDAAKWKTERRFCSTPDNEFAIFLNDVPDVLQVKHNVVRIKPKTLNSHFSHTKKPLKSEHNLGNACTGRPDTEECYRDGNGPTHGIIIPPFISAQFSTKDSFAFKYGRVEVRAKLPSGTAWVYPQLWLEPLHNAYGMSNYKSGQMRIGFNHFNGETDELFGGVLLNSEQPFRSAKLCRSSVVGDNEFHVYKLIWTENIILMAVDDQEYCRYPVDKPENEFRNLRVNDKDLPNKDALSDGSALAPFDKEFYITIGYGIGGHNEFTDDLCHWKIPKPWPNSEPRAMERFWDDRKEKVDKWLENGDLLVDYVKVFAV